MKRTTTPAPAPADPAPKGLARFQIMGGTCAHCHTANPTTVPMHTVGHYPEGTLFLCPPCLCKLVLDVAECLPGCEAIFWHEVKTGGPIDNLPDDETTVIGMREEWSEPKPVSLRAGFWVDHTMRGMVLDEGCQHPENKPPKWWADWPAGPCDGKPRHGGKAKQ